MATPFPLHVATISIAFQISIPQFSHRLDVHVDDFVLFNGARSLSDEHAITTHTHTQTYT